MSDHILRYLQLEVSGFDEIWPSYLAIENLSSPIENAIFKSVRHPRLWGVYPEVSMALAQNS